MKHPRRWWLVAATLVAVAAGIAALAASAGSGSATRHAVMYPGTDSAALYRSIGQPLANPQGTVHFGCQLTSYQTDGIECYGPDQIRAAYGIQPLLDKGYDGTGRTIVIIDAYGSPTIQADLAQFDAVWGLSDPSHFNVVAPYGIDATDPNNAFGWALESSLDVEWAHSVAPGANIELVVAKSNSDSDILDATQWVLDHNAGDVVSQSYGEAEQCMDPTQLDRQHKLFAQMTRQDITLFASSGDQGAGIPTCDGSAYFKATSTPASDPYVTSVGGTMLFADGVSGAYQGETTWNESTTIGDAVGGGGGVSVVYSAPSYQMPALNSRSTSAHHDHGDHGRQMREVPDVSYNAGIYTGVIVVQGGGYWLVGGTSAGSPQWAGLTAIADQIGHGRVGSINKALYRVGTSHDAGTYLHDIADGSNNSIPDLTPYLGASYGTPIDGYTAVPGYDMATGLGTPIASTLLPYLARNGEHGDAEHGWGSTGSGTWSSNGNGHKHDN